MVTEFKWFTPLGIVAVFACALALNVRAQEAPTATEYNYQLSNVEAGEYVLEHDHGRIHWSVSHHGFSMFTAVLPLVDATLDFDPVDITNSKLEVTVDMTAVDSSIESFNERLNSPTFFNTEQYPTSVFKSTQIEMTGDNTFDVTGDLTFLGVTAPLTMSVNFTASTTPQRPPGGYRVGFDATSSMIRSEWGMPKTTVGDEVKFSIEAEFLRPQ